MNIKQNICLNYHDFSGNANRVHQETNYTIEFDIFKKQLNKLSGLPNIPFSGLLSGIQNFELSYCLTFDDGYKSSLYVAEELAKRSLKGTFFIIRNKSASDLNYLNSTDIRAIRSMGHEIASHSCSHIHLNRLSREKLIYELVASKSFLEDILSEKVNSISFPGGHFSSRVMRASSEAGYLLKKTCISGVNHIPVEEGLVKSINIKKSVNDNQFTEIINLSTRYFLKVKLRQVILTIPKYIESRIQFG
jgi:peptidoglycan/xylan/chitin deacetylase (PgdA/CDA1 family)